MHWQDKVNQLYAEQQAVKKAQEIQDNLPTGLYVYRASHYASPQEAIKSNAFYVIDEPYWNEFQNPDHVMSIIGTISNVEHALGMPQNLEPFWISNGVILCDSNSGTGSHELNEETLRRYGGMFS